jgi:cyanophycin synthetase
MINSYIISFKINKSLIPLKKDLNSIDTWLIDILHLEKVDDTSTQTLEEKVLNRVFILYNKFLYQLKVPIFNPPKILSVFKDKSDFEIKIMLYNLEYLPTTFFNTIFNLCFKYITNDFLKKSSKENILDFYKKIDNEVIKPYIKYSGASKSSIPILETAIKMNIPVFNLSRGIFQLGWGCNSTMLIGTSVCKDSKIGSQIVGNKMLTANFLKKAALPYPVHKLVFKEEECYEAVKRLSYPVVVKPCDENEGRGVTVNIDDEKKLIKFL